MRTIFASLLVAIVVAACSGGMPKPNTTGPVQTLGGGFLIESGKLKYGMTYSAAGHPSPIYGKAEFENPESASAPMTVKLGELDRSKNIIAQSPQFAAIRNNATYSVTLYIYTDPEMTQLIDTHTDQVKFAMPPDVLKQVGIKVL